MSLPQLNIDVLSMLIVPLIYFGIAFANTLVFLHLILTTTLKARSDRLFRISEMLLYFCIPLLPPLLLNGGLLYTMQSDNPEKVTYIAISLAILLMIFSISISTYTFAKRITPNKKAFLICLIIYGVLAYFFPRSSGSYDTYSSSYKCSCAGIETSGPLGIDSSSSICFGVPFSCREHDVAYP